MRWLILLFALLAMTAQGRGDDRDGHNINLNHNSNSSSSESYGAGGQASASNDGVRVDGDDHDSEFFSFATTFPQASGCFGGVQAGGSSSGSGGFFGMHFINHDCWTSALAEAEANVEVRALLKCAGGKFRDAIAFEQTKNKQRYCVDFMIGKYGLEVERAAATVDQAIDQGDLEVTAVPIVLAGNVSEEQLEEELQEQRQFVEDKNAQQQNQIDDLKRRTLQAERKATDAERKLLEFQQQQTSKKQALQQLQQQLREDYATVPSATQ